MMNIRKSLKGIQTTCCLIGDFVNFLRMYLDDGIRHLRKTYCISLTRICPSMLTGKEKEGTMVQTKCDPRSLQQLNLLNTSISLEDAMASASEVIEPRDILNKLNITEQYAFWKGYEFASAKYEARTQSIREKHESLMHKWDARYRYLAFFSGCLN